MVDNNNDKKDKRTYFEKRMDAMDRRAEKLNRIIWGSDDDEEE